MKIEKENNVYNEIPIMHNADNAKHMGKKILKPIIQEKIVKVPVTQYVEKIIEKEEIKYVNKYVDVVKPIITYKTKHILKPIYLDKIKYETKVLEREKIIHIPKIEYKNKIVEVPVYVHREKLIEKKVPLVIERVIPVLNVKTSEKNVLADTIATPSICVISEKDKVDKHLKCVTEQQHKENSNGITQNKMSFASSMRSNEVDVANMQTYVSNQESIREQVNENISRHIKGKKIGSDASSSKDSANGDNESNIGKNAPLKHNTQYQGESNEHIHADEHVEEAKEEANYISHTEEHFAENRPEYIVNGEHNDFNAAVNSEYNTTRFNADMSEHVHARDNDEYEHKFTGNHSNYDASTHNIMDMNNNVMFNENGQLYVVKNENEIRAFSEQQYNPEPTHMEPKVYSFPFHGSYQNKYQEITHEQTEADPNYTNINMLRVPKEHYGSVHTIQNERTVQTPSKPTLMPSYANGNGQAILSVRPATIVEYKPKARKHRASLCNFLNNCCRGNQE